MKLSFKIFPTVLFLGGLAGTSGFAQAPPASLKGFPVPEPDLVAMGIAKPGAAAKLALQQLGKALYWDMQAGSDGRTACASCHFHAGADHRDKNQRNPGHDGVFSEHEGANSTVKTSDFPLHHLAVKDDRHSHVVSDTNDRVSSQGVFRSDFLDIVAGNAVDSANFAIDDTPFRVAGVNVRRVEPRNTPTVINAVFNRDNFWDGRADFCFNGSNPRGPSGTTNIIKMVGQTPRQQGPAPICIPFSSLASQAVGPPLSAFEMSAAGRNWRKVGEKLLHLPALAPQRVDPTDSLLGPLVPASGPGLTTTYRALIQAAFDPDYWDDPQEHSFRRQRKRSGNWHAREREPVHVDGVQLLAVLGACHPEV